MLKMYKMSHLTKYAFSQNRQSLLACLKRAQLARTNSTTPVQGIPNTKIKSVGGDSSPEDGGSMTTSRSHFAEVYPKLYVQQEFHLKQLRAGIPVHASGKRDPVILPVTYAVSLALFLYSLYLYKDLI